MARIFLIGMPGSGKSTLGARVAGQVGLSFYDLDMLIEAEERCSIPEIFERKGEQHFRETERDLLQSTIKSSDHFLMATGGGTPCFYDNLSRMNDAGFTVFIDTPITTIVKRLTDTDVVRPKLKHLDVEKTLKETYHIRKPFYVKANFTLTGEKVNDKGLIQLIKSF
ncbi:MAG: shikimate kinase [Bacteroidota bacterium]